MKNYLFIILISLLGFSGCKELDDVSINDVSAPVEIELNVLSADSIGEKETEVDAASNSDFMNNKSKVQSLEIERISYRVMAWGASTADSLIIGKFEWFNPTTNAYEEISTVINKKFVAEVPYDLALQTSVINQMANQFTSVPYKAKVRFKAAMNKKPVDFIIKIKVFLKLKVKL